MFRLWLRAQLIAVVLGAASPALLAAQTTTVKPGFNLFTVDQDIQLGRQSAAEVDRQIPMISDPNVEGYVSRIGKRLAAVAPGPKFPYQFKVTNLSDVNAFALPGGFMYVNRGLIELTRTEGELAGVMAHEMSHVALRHQTNQVTKAYIAQAGLGVLESLLGAGSGAREQVIQTVGGLGLNTLFLKFSRSHEQQADEVGEQILAKAGYDPNEMADMFTLLQRQAGDNPSALQQFFSDHPSTADRITRARQEAREVGRGQTRPPVGDLNAVRAALQKLPPAPSMQQVARRHGPEAPQE